MSPTRRDSGFTLLEVMVTIVLMGILLALSVGGWSKWSRAREQSGTAQELRTVLRTTQQRAVTEGTSMCVTFGTTSYTVYRATCGTGAVVLGPMQVNGQARLSGAAFTPLTAAQAPNTLVFTPRGTASAGLVHVTRADSSKDYSVKVDGFTGRVSLCDGSVCTSV
jgi:type II secretion system protein H